MVKRCIFILSILITILVAFIVPIVSLEQLWIVVVTLIASYLGLTIIYFVFLYFVSLTIDMKKEYDSTNKFYNTLYLLTLEYLISASRTKLVVKGKEKLPKEKYLLVFNHKSRFDPIIQSYVLRKDNLVQISKPENFKIPLGGPFMKRCCNLSIDRDNNRNALKTILKGAEFISSQKFSIGIAPEGTRNFEEGLLPFKSGSFKMAYKAKCPVVICTMTNTFNIHKNFPWKKTIVEMHIVDIIKYDEFKDMPTHELAYMVRRKMIEDLNIKEEKEESELHII